MNWDVVIDSCHCKNGSTSLKKQKRGNQILKMINNMIYKYINDACRMQ